MLRDVTGMRLNGTHMQMQPRLLLAPLFALGLGGCGLISADFEGQVKLVVDVNDDDSSYFAIKDVNPEDNQDYRDNKDKIREGRIDSIDLEFIQIGAENLSQIVVGQVDVRHKGDTDWITGVGAWEGIQVIQGNKFRLNLAAEQQEAINKLVFEEGGILEFQLAGVADQGPVKFQVQVVLNMTFTASL
jgi:hypothetical protein